MTNDEYFNDIIIQFPTLEAIMNEDIDMIHMRMEGFADYTIDQIKNNNESELKRCFDFQESKIDLMTFDLINALYVSYCEALLLGECADKMNKVNLLMPSKLKAAYFEYEKHYNDLVEKSRQF